MNFPRILAPISVLLLFSGTALLPRLDQPSTFEIQIQNDPIAARSFSFNEVELERDPARYELRRLLRDLNARDDPIDGGIHVTLMRRSYKDRVVELLESHSIEYSIGYYTNPFASAIITAFHTHEHYSTGKDIKAKVLSFQSPIFSKTDLEMMIYINSDETLNSYSIGTKWE